MVMKKILLLLSVFVLFACEQEDLNRLVDDGKAEVGQQATVGSRAATIADFDPIDQLYDMPVNIINVGNSKNKYLSCAKKGDLVDLYNKDDGSLRQRWIFAGKTFQGTYKILLAGGHDNYAPKAGGLNVGKRNDVPSVGLTYASLSLGIGIFKKSGLFYNIMLEGGLQGGFPAVMVPDLYLQADGYESTKLTYKETNSGTLAQWEIKPLGEFEILDIQYLRTVEDELEIKDIRVYTRTFKNEQGEMPQKHTLTISEALTNKSQFSVVEGVSVNITSGIKVGIPKIADLNFGTDSNKSWTYTTTEEETKTTTVQDVHEVEIPPFRNYRIDVYVVNYKMNITYVATLRNIDTKQTFKVKGKWSGDLVDVNDITYETINLGTGKVVSTYSRKTGYK